VDIKRGGDKKEWKRRKGGREEGERERRERTRNNKQEHTGTTAKKAGRGRMKRAVLQYWWGMHNTEKNEKNEYLH
jgi:hypothetical protein